MAPIASASATDLETAQRLRVTVRRISRLLRPTDAGSAAGLSPTGALVLLNAMRNGSVRLADVAAQEGLNPTMLSRVVADLVEAGLIERTSDPVDRRSAWIKVTSAGKRLAERMRRERTKAVDAALSELSDADRRLVEEALPALEQLADRLAEHRP